MSNKAANEALGSRLQLCRWLTAFAGVAALICVTANAQKTTEKSQVPVSGSEPKTATAMTQTVPTPRPAGNMLAASADDRYRIGPGDVLDIRILNRPNLSRDAVRVEGDGTIRMPLIDGRIQAACLTETELSKEITNRYLKFYRNPQVDVFIKDYRSTQ